MLAFHGAVNARGRHRNVALVLSVLLVLIAMGGYTPLYGILYQLVPGFSFVRAPSKFLFFASVFLSVLVGLGIDRLGESGRGVRRTTLVALGICALLTLAAIWTLLSPAESPDALSPINLLSRLWGGDDFIVEGELADWHAMMLGSWVLAAGVAALAALLIGSARRSRLGFALLVGVAVLELLLFARANRGETRITAEIDLRPRAAEAYRMAGTTRVIETAAPSNIAVAQRNFGLWGYDPVILGRYVRFMAFTQGTRPERVKNPTLIRPEVFHPLHSMLRGRYQVMWRTNELVDHPGALPQFVFARSHTGDRGRQSDPGRDESAGLRSAPNGHPRARAVDSAGAREPGADPSRIWILERSSDHIDLEVEVESPVVLVMTDAYSRGWKVRGLHGSDQSEYELLPANYVLRGDSALGRAPPPAAGVPPGRLRGRGLVDDGRGDDLPGGGGLVAGDRRRAAPFAGSPPRDEGRA